MRRSFILIYVANFRGLFCLFISCCPVPNVSAAPFTLLSVLLPLFFLLPPLSSLCFPYSRPSPLFVFPTPAPAAHNPAAFAPVLALLPAVCLAIYIFLHAGAHFTPFSEISPPGTPRFTSLYPMLLFTLLMCPPSAGLVTEAFSHPGDFNARFMGHMMSKEYGQHEQPHTEKHLWASPNPPRHLVTPPSSPHGHRATPPASPQGTSPSRAAAAGGISPPATFALFPQGPSEGGGHESAGKGMWEGAVGEGMPKQKVPWGEGSEGEEVQRSLYSSNAAEQPAAGTGAGAGAGAAGARPAAGPAAAGAAGSAAAAGRPRRGVMAAIQQELSEKGFKAH